MSITHKLLPTSPRQTVTSLFPVIMRRLCSVSSKILHSDLEDIVIPKISIPELIISKCAKYEGLVATECAITGRKYFFGEILKKSKNLSRALRKKLNLQEEDVVAFLLPNVPEFIIAALGVLQAGLIITTLNPAYTSEEISRQLTNSSAKALITTKEFWNAANTSFTESKHALPTFIIKTEQTQSLPPGTINFQEFIDNPIDYPEIPPRKHEDIAFVPYSSGTTGLPKGVLLTHRNIVANLCQLTSPAIDYMVDATESHQDVVPDILPMFHIYGFTVNSLTALVKGAKAVTLPKFTPEDYVATLRKHKPHVLLLVPPVVIFLADHSMVKSSDLQSIRAVMSGAAPLGSLDEERFLKKVGRKILLLQGYGLTETSPVVSSLSEKLIQQTNTSGSIGVPLPNTLVKIIAPDDPTGIPLGPNTSGELLVKGPQVMKGYLNRPEDTKQAFMEGWLRTGDMARYNEEKLLFITDRLKELIKVKGLQVAPAELEEIIRDFPHVEDAAVIGIPDARLGEAPRAYVVPKKDTKFVVDDLVEYVKKKVAQHKQLSGGVAIVDSIPKNASGKILRRTLKLEFLKSIEK